MTSNPKSGATRKDSSAADSVASSAASEADAIPHGAYLDALEDVHTRFILNLPTSELQSADRIFFQLEQAWWFYEDWICDPDPDCSLPRFSNLKPFARQLFTFSPLLPDNDQEFNSMWQAFSNYKRKISNYGCILLSADCSKVVLCKLWNSKTYTFPAGKINQGEDGMSAAARETYEETGFDPSCVYGMTAKWKETEPHKVTWTTLTEADALHFQETDGGKRRTCYVSCGVPDDFPFEPVARKEISSISWHDLDNLPPKSYAVVPFISQLRRWIKRQRKQGTIIASNTGKKRDKTPKQTATSTTQLTVKTNKTPTRNRSNRRGSRNNSRAKVRSQDDLIESGLANEGDTCGWSEEDMFKVNERLLGRKIEYDGNPHVFAEQGFFDGKDPHAFHVVGGGFLNAEEASLPPAPDKSKLQPLFRIKDMQANADQDGNDDALQPFFSDEGATPWGAVIQEAKEASPTKVHKHSQPQQTVNPGQALLNMLQKSTTTAPPAHVSNEFDSLFLTDGEITAASRNRNTQKSHTHAQEQEQKYQQDMAFVRNWVANLPQPTPKHFGPIRFDADEIMAVAMASLESK